MTAFTIRSKTTGDQRTFISDFEEMLPNSVKTQILDLAHGVDYITNDEGTIAIGSINGRNNVSLRLEYGDDDYFDPETFLQGLTDLELVPQPHVIIQDGRVQAEVGTVLFNLDEIDDSLTESTLRALRKKAVAARVYYVVEHIDRILKKEKL